MSQDEEDFAAMLEASFAGGGQRTKKLRPGAVVTGAIVAIGKDKIFVDVGTRSEGEIDRHQLETRDGELTVAVGDRVELTVVSGGDRPTLAKNLGRGAVDASSLELARDSKTPVEGTFTKAVKGGLTVDVGGVRAFCPASQVDTTYTEDISVYEGQTDNFLVIEVRDQGRSVVVSRRARIEAERAAAADQVLASLAVGQDVDGTVESIQAYGAFVNLGGVQGLIHISELGHGRVDQVSDVVSVGEQVRVRVLAIEGDGKKRRIRLSMRALDPNAPARGGGKRKEAKILEGKVQKVESFGVFVETEEGTGLVSNRELDLPPGGDPRRAYPAGKEVRVVALPPGSDGKLRFSLRRVEEAEARQNFQAFKKKAAKESSSLGSLGALLKEKLGDLE